ncbi:DUF3014 domain-containing protein [Steroidobacter sp.]|uniref:DUF3014 domain-containing protein n=1 Tax=Steroidobacter sp. TaxID=1978227 RepID=UPI0025EBA344|nr:DUF3014 domain-containing protein [Steroidobacter sp.]
MEEDTKKWLYYAIPVVVAVGIGAALYYGRSQRKVEQPVQAPVAVTQPEVTTPVTEPPIRNPVAETPPTKPLPGLNDSDPSLQESLSGLFGSALEPYLVPKNIIRHTVVTIDNLPRKKTAVQMWPVKPIGGELLATGNGEELTLGADNYARYDRLIKILQSADAAQIATLYKQYYPLFQEAYVSLGYPDGYFNDRLVEVIDHLLATPEVSGPILLRRPSVNFEFADAELEARSTGQKLLIRMGSANAAVVKDKLRQLRKAVAKQEPAAG